MSSPIGSRKACCTIRATTAAPRKGVFHIAEGGLPIPADKIAVPKQVFAALARGRATAAGRVIDPAVIARRRSPQAVLRFAAAAAAGLSRDAGRTRQRPWRSASSRRAAWSAISISWRRIFGNAGDPYLPENDAALDVMHWTGHTGCVILAPHLARLRKKDLGLPHVERRHRAAEARRHVLGDAKTNCTTAAAPSR